MKSINPFTEEVIDEYPEDDDSVVESKLAQANFSFADWSQSDFSYRADLMMKVADVLRQGSRHYGELMTLEMGKPLKQAIAEVEKCAWVCEYYAQNAERFLADEVVETDALKSYVRFEPLGIVLAVMPWNFPFWQVIRFLAPALMAGNVGVLKHASNVSGCALALAEVFERAGFPKGVFTVLLVGSSRVESLVADVRIRAVTLTGSEFAGTQVAMQAGSHIKKTVLELGGSDPFIVFDDADLEKAVDVAVMARMQNNGQSCIASKRFLLQCSISEKFIAMFAEKISALKIGDPMSESCDVGPLATASIREDIVSQVNDSVSFGAHVVCGGKAVSGKGFFYEPTILSAVKKGMVAYSEELFGPVASCIEFVDEDEAIFIANDTSFGLGACVWTRDMDRVSRLVRAIESGAVFVNGMVKSDPRLPFGGVKKSGYGRELSSYGIREFVNIKTVWIAGEKEVAINNVE